MAHPTHPRRDPPHLNRGGRGNRARLEAMREAERISPILEAIPPALRSDPAADRGRDQRCSGDAVFQAPMDAWEDLRLLLNRSVDPEDLVDLPGPGDPLDRSRALACFLAPRSVDPLGRALMEAVSEVPALTFTGGYLEATARLATLTTLGLAVEARGTHLLMDRAVQVALAHYAVEEVLEVAGDISESVPPAPVLHQRITGAEPGPLPASLSPSPAAARLLLPALQHAAQVIPTPTPRPPPMEPPRHLPPDGTPESVVEQAILSSEPDQAPGDALRCLVEDQEALLAAGGRAQVEMAAAALAAGRHLAPQAQALLKRAFREFRGAALRLLEVRARLEQGDNPLLPALLFKETTEAAGAMEHARRSLLLSLAALVERDAQGL